MEGDRFFYLMVVVIALFGLAYLRSRSEPTATTPLTQPARQQSKTRSACLEQG